MMRTLALAIVAWLCALGCVQAQIAKPDIGIEQRLNALVPRDVAFRDDAGATVALQKYLDERPVVLMLAYYRCPRLCSVSLNNLAASLAKIDAVAGRDYEVVIVSIDPRETPELAAAKKSALLEQYAPPGGAAGWHFLTGDEPSIQRLASTVGFRYAYDAELDLYAHSSGVMILTSDGRLARYFFGIDVSARDLQFGLEDASAGKIGSPVAQPLRMLCFSYDAETGKYTLMTMRLVQIGGVITVLLLGVFLLRAWFRNAKVGQQGE